MKFNIKPMYIYLAGILLAVVIFFFMSGQNDSNVDIPNKGTASQQMPNDNVHKGMMDNQPPGKSNVAAGVMEHLADLKKAADENPSDTVKIKQYAEFAAAAHQKDAAIEYFNKILKIDPERSDIRFSISYVYYLNKDFDKAEENLNKILSYDKNNLNAKYNIGAVEANRGNSAKAKTIWTELAEKHPDTKIGKLAKASLAQLK